MLRAMLRDLTPPHSGSVYSTKMPGTTGAFKEGVYYCMEHRAYSNTKGVLQERTDASGPRRRRARGTTCGRIARPFMPLASHRQHVPLSWP